MNWRTARTMAVAAMVSAGVAACVDSPSAPLATADENQLATTFDVIAQEQLVAGDVERSEEFRWAALAVRLGITPTRFEVTNDGVAEVYDALVHAVGWNLPNHAMRPLGHRSLIAWRRTDQKMQVIIVNLRSDEAPVLHHFSMRPTTPGSNELTAIILAARAAYFERGPEGSAWIGISGSAKIALESLGQNCANVNANNDRPRGITCQLARFLTRFDIVFAKTRDRDSRDVDAQPDLRRIVAPEQIVNGVKLTFSCIAPASTAGCG